MAIAFFIFCIFPSFRLFPSKLLWYIFMVSGSLRSFQGFLLSLNMAIIVILQSTSDYSIFDVFVSQFVFVVSAVSFFHVFYILLQASYVWLCAVNCIWKIICRNSLWQRHRISPSSENFCCVVQGFLDSQSTGPQIHVVLLLIHACFETEALQDVSVLGIRPWAMTFILLFPLGSKLCISSFSGVSKCP